MQEKKYIIELKWYKNSKSFFGGLIRVKQRYLMKMPKRYSRLSHSELALWSYDDKEIIKRLNKIESIYFWKSNETKIFNYSKRKEYFEKYKLWFSSSETDGWSRFKFIQENKENWVSYKFIFTKKEYLKILDFCIIQEGQAYNTLGIIFWQALGVQWFRRYGDWFCSQISLAALQQVKIFCWIDAISQTPGQLQYLAEKGKLFK